MMKKLNLLLGLFLLGSALVFQSCGDAQKTTKEVAIVSKAVANPAKAMVQLYEKHGDYVNAKGSPYLLAADDVYYNKADYLLIDIRTKDDYVKGHIDGAYNVQRDSLIPFVAKMDGSKYKKIVLCDNDGFESAYAASILRGLGYNNAFPLKYGMGAWNGTFAKGWQNSGSNKYQSAVEKKSYPKHAKGNLPKLDTKATTLPGIINERSADVIADDFLVSVDDVMNHKDDYYIVNYWPKDKYEAAHLPGAVWYAPKKSLYLNGDLLTLPTNKKIALYCYTGLSASTVVGYLRLIGYDVYAIKWGANSFMYNLLKEKGWHAYNYAEKAGSYPLLKGEKRTEKKAVKVSAANTSAPAAPKPVIHRKKKESGGGGCD